jgi:NADH dehydrogenase FAD-containing subunit
MNAVDSRPKMTTRVVLVGGGHAHLAVVSRAEALRQAGAEVSLIDPGMLWYSGMATGMLGGRYAPSEDTVDLAALCRRRGAGFHSTRAVSVDRRARRLRTESGETIAYDLLSLNVGSVIDTGGIDDPDALAWTVKPIPQLAGLRERLEDRARRGGTCAVGVVGGGPTGVEIAANIEALCSRSGGTADVTILHGGDRLLPGFPESAADTLDGVLETRGITVRPRTRVARLSRGRQGILAETPDAQQLPFDEMVLATGLVASPVVSALGLGDQAGLRVDARLTCLEDPTIFGAGDCISFAPRELPKVGVFGVRQGPILAENILASLTGGELQAYQPQEKFLIILNMGDGTGLAIRGGRHWHGRLAFMLKHFLDKRFLKRYRQGP